MTTSSEKADVVRFSGWERLQHAAMIVLFLALLLTGMPQKWPYVEASRWLIDVLGGIYVTRFIHRMAGLAFTGLALAHVTSLLYGTVRGKLQPTIVFTKKDFVDAIENLKYYLGRKPSPPKFGRFDYRQKWEYWGLLFGSVIMVVSGLVLYLPTTFARFMPAELIPAAKVMHSNEALLAFLIVIIWHMYGAHLNPDVFPLDSSIFTGKISKERLAHEHALEYEELFGKAEDRDLVRNEPVGLPWQVMLHGTVAAAAIGPWLRRERLGPGPTRRLAHGAIVGLPLLTAAIPGRADHAFRDRWAWFDSGRVLELPLVAGLTVEHAVALAALIAAAAFLWQEVLPVLRRLHPRTRSANEEEARRVGRLAPTGGYRLRLIDDEAIVLTTAGLPGRSRLHVSTGALEGLTDAELGAVIRHEMAHGRPRRWWAVHALWFARTLQFFSPVALWAFREYLVEIEIACDGEAVDGGDPKPLARALLKVYEETDSSEVAARSTLKRRVDRLLGSDGHDPEREPIGAVALAVVTLALVLPWVVCDVDGTERLKSALRFLVIVVLVLAGLRVLHLTVPLFYPDVLSGPFSLESFDEVERYTGFSPLIPFYRPEILGHGPVSITAWRRPEASVVVYWQGERYLQLRQRRGGAAPTVAEAARPLPGQPDARWWRNGWTNHVVLRQGDSWVELKTDLEQEDIERVLRTLRPYASQR